MPPLLITKSQIKSQNDHETLSAFSLVCRSFCSSSRRVLLSEIFLGSFSHELGPKEEQLKVLAQGTTSACQLARTLTIDYEREFMMDPPNIQTSLQRLVQRSLKKAIIDYLKKAILSFKNVRRVV